MENSSEALIMAGSVLIFIIALTVTISSFSTLRTGVEKIVSETETVKLAKDGAGNYINYMKSDSNKATRVVGAETVISSMYRTFKENYVVYIQYAGLESAGSSISLPSDSNIKISIQESPETDILIDGNNNILKFGININDKILVNSNSEIYNKYKELMNIFYDKIKEKKFQEYLGEYQEKVVANSEERITYRIITYIETT